MENFILMIRCFRKKYGKLHLVVRKEYQYLLPCCKIYLSFCHKDLIIYFDSERKLNIFCRKKNTNLSNADINGETGNAHQNSTKCMVRRAQDANSNKIADYAVLFTGKFRGFIDQKLVSKLDTHKIVKLSEMVLRGKQSSEKVEKQSSESGQNIACNALWLFLKNENFYTGAKSDQMVSKNQKS